MQPTTNADGTIDAIIAEPAKQCEGYSAIHLRLPVGIGHGLLAGRYFLVRCGAQSLSERDEEWHFYFRRALFVAGRQSSHGREKILQGKGLHRADVTDADVTDEGHDCWQIVTPRPATDGVQLAQAVDPAIDWLSSLESDEIVNLLGPFGNGFRLLEDARNLLLMADERRVATLFPLIEPVLDRNGRVTLLLKGRSRVAKSVTALLPFAVEVLVAETADEWRQQCDGAISWADQICAALPMSHHRGLADAIRRKRFRLEPGFAQMLVEADLVCGVGACLACVVPIATGGLTRACIHGPVIDLVTLVG